MTGGAGRGLTLQCRRLLARPRASSRQGSTDRAPIGMTRGARLFPIEHGHVREFLTPQVRSPLGHRERPAISRDRAPPRFHNLAIFLQSPCGDMTADSSFGDAVRIDRIGLVGYSLPSSLKLEVSLVSRPSAPTVLAVSEILPSADSEGQGWMAPQGHRPDTGAAVQAA